MEDKNVMTILKEEFENGMTKEKVLGLTIIIDGKLKQIMDIIMENNNYKDYADLIKDLLFKGINDMHKKNNL